MHPSPSAEHETLLTSVYSFLRRAGALDTSPGRRLFTSAYFFYKRFFEDDLHSLLQSYPALLRGGNVLDIGANIGYTAGLLAQAITRGNKVYAFEPEPFNYGILQRVAANPKFQGKVVALQSAVGADNGTIDLWLNDRHHADHRIITDRFRGLNARLDSFRVPLVSIDRFLESNPGPVSFVKIDVQGYELPVCQGMNEALQRNPDITIVLEYMPSAMLDLGFNPSDVIDFLVDRSFRVYVVHPKGKVLPGRPPEKMERTAYVDLLFSRHPIAPGGGA